MLVYVWKSKHGYGLDILINDPDWKVRREVAQQGYKLEVLVYDENRYVRSVSKSNIYLKKFLNRLVI